MEIKGKKLIILGERDGVQAQTIAVCMEAIGADIYHVDTQCFVWTAAGAMDQSVQRKLKDAAEEFGNENVLVILGTPDTESADIYAETVMAGDPTYSGPLADLPLRLNVYHILEEEVKTLIPSDLYEEHIGLMELSLDTDGIRETMREARKNYSA